MLVLMWVVRSMEWTAEISKWKVKAEGHVNGREEFWPLDPWGWMAKIKKWGGGKMAEWLSGDRRFVGSNAMDGYNPIAIWEGKGQKSDGFM